MLQQTWFITGASSGFGEAFAQFALANGHNVVATARDTSKLEAVRSMAPERVLTHRLDVTKAGEADMAIAAAVARFGRIDVLINNAGYGSVGAVEETPENELRAQMETNFFGAAAVIKAVLPTLRAQKSGAIVNISSMGGQLSFAGFGAYSASKFALEGLSEALAAEVSSFGIRVLIVEPGAFRTTFASASLRHMPEMEVYRDSVGATRRLAHSMDKSQAGDPMKAAAAIAKALGSSKMPLRLQLGRDSLDAVREHSEQLLNDLRTWESLGAATALDDR